jgi:hypothetical protein
LPFFRVLRNTHHFLGEKWSQIGHTLGGSNP